MAGVSNNFKLIRLWEKHSGVCFYCGIKTKLPISGHHKKHNHSSNIATIEHVYNKMDIRRFLENKKVLCCYKCNNSKGAIDYDNVFNSNGYKVATDYKDLEWCPFRNLITTLVKSSDTSKYLI